MTCRLMSGGRARRSQNHNHLFATERPFHAEKYSGASPSGFARHALSHGGIERMAFYEAAKKSYAVVATGERRFYGCFILKKGVIAPDA